MLVTRAPVFLRQILSNSAVQFVKFRYYLQIPYIPRPVGIVVLTDNNSKYKEFIVAMLQFSGLYYFQPFSAVTAYG